MHEPCIFLHQSQTSRTRNGLLIADIREEIPQMLEKDTFEQPLVFVAGSARVTCFDQDAMGGDEGTSDDRVDEMLGCGD